MARGSDADARDPRSTAGPLDEDPRSLAEQLAEDDDAILMESETESDHGVGVSTFLNEPERIPAEQSKIKTPQRKKKVEIEDVSDQSGSDEPQAMSSARMGTAERGGVVGPDMPRARADILTNCSHKRLSPALPPSA